MERKTQEVLKSYSSFCLAGGVLSGSPTLGAVRPASCVSFLSPGAAFTSSVSREAYSICSILFSVETKKP